MLLLRMDTALTATKLLLCACPCMRVTTQRERGLAACCVRCWLDQPARPLASRA
jgi:hypothetical protein